MDSRVEFPGFQIYTHKDELVFRGSMMSRLQKRAPCPLQIKPSHVITPSACSGAQNSKGTPSASTSTSSSSSLNSFFTSKDPIPLLSPLAVLESTSIREENTAKSH